MCVRLCPRPLISVSQVCQLNAPFPPTLPPVFVLQARGEDPKSYLSYNYLFLGNPGTGKTTIARRMGTMFKALGLLPDDTVEEISASDLSTGFSGQSGKKTREIMRKARGGVLFIDEAYQLDPARGGAPPPPFATFHL